MGLLRRGHKRTEEEPEIIWKQRKKMHKTERRYRGEREDLRGGRKGKRNPGMTQGHKRLVSSLRTSYSF